MKSKYLILGLIPFLFNGIEVSDKEFDMKTSKTYQSLTFIVKKEASGDTFNTIQDAIDLLPPIICHDCTVKVCLGTYADTETKFGDGA